MSGTQEWSIRILVVDGATAFQPWGVGAQPGDPAQASIGNVVTWGNATDETHQPWPTVGNTNNGAPVADADNLPGSTLYYSDPIPPQSSSTPQFIVPAAPAGSPSPPTLWYCCKNHPTERGCILIV